MQGRMLRNPGQRERFVQAVRCLLIWGYGVGWVGGKMEGMEGLWVQCPVRRWQMRMSG